MVADESAGPALRERVILVGVGGPTCSGKTMLAQHLKNIIPNSFIVHQDDFATPEDLVPYHPIHNVQDWDDPPGAIDWPRFTSFLTNLKSAGRIPESHQSHNHLNPRTDFPLSPFVIEHWRSVFQGIDRNMREKGDKVTWGLIDGFLLYWDPRVVEALDVKIFLRTPQEVMKRRREERVYHTIGSPVDSFWTDPPGYFTNIAYPAYVKAHSSLFVNGDVEHGALSEEAQRLGLVVIRGDGGEGTGYGEVVGEVCGAIVRFMRVEEGE